MAKPFREKYAPPWRVEPTPGGYMIVDRDGAALAYTYAEKDDTKVNTDKLSDAEALALARAIAALNP